MGMKVMVVRAVFGLAVAATSACGLAGCFGTGGKSATSTVPVHHNEESRLPPIYPGTTVSIPPSTTTSAGLASTIPGDGTYRVGVDIRPGTYRTSGSYSCYWARLRGLGGTSADIIANSSAAGPQIVQIAPTDAAFKTQGCPTWILDSGAAATSTPTTAITSVTLPAGAQQCPTVGGPAAGFSRSAAGSPATSCQFAEQVRQAYGASGPASSQARQIVAVSPVTGQSYTMSCAANGGLVTCTGGDDAVVYVY